MGFYVDYPEIITKRRGSRHNIDRRTYLVDAVSYAKRGNELPQAKVTPDIVRKIRKDAAQGITAKSQASEYGLHIRTVEAIRSYRTWIHI